MQMVVSHLATGVYACALDRTRAEMAGLAGKLVGQLARLVDLVQLVAAFVLQ
jgi:hypothetical protein